MELPNIRHKHAVYVESREARAVIIDDCYCKDDWVAIKIKADLSISHMRTWAGDEAYIERAETQSEWSLGCTKELIILHEDFAQGPYAGWQLLIDDKTFEKFAIQDDSWVEDWF